MTRTNLIDALILLTVVVLLVYGLPAAVPFVMSIGR